MEKSFKYLEVETPSQAAFYQNRLLCTTPLNGYLPGPLPIKKGYWYSCLSCCVGLDRVTVEGMPRTVVLKFGGASVATPEHFHDVAKIIIERSLCYPRVAVVLSAMGETTDYLLTLARQINTSPQERELDMLVTAGERVSIALLAMALARQGKEAISFTGSQTGIITSHRHTEARIVDVRPWRILPHLNSGKTVIVAGFQGVSTQGEITSLGRGGSDTTAVALGAALGAEVVEFFKDVDGVYEQDPKQHPRSLLLPHLTYQQALELLKRTQSGVLHGRSIQLAQKNQIPLRVLSYLPEALTKGTGTWIGDIPPDSVSRIQYPLRSNSCFYEEEDAHARD